ncbi:hypothetical protein NIA71_11555 [Ihubacter massiliensis]|uniref:Uncharacterized protein n=1 Tax=Hominibacterium faecale TaxID=2839743 RepID=A0A9J6QQA5_9FIRM|nr:MULTISPECIES: hypothetical protein [Eubacteriales Family XIII. Incertae Sedis]MCO7122578.1 hypothetical protein [Ihubacter massiliensis]MCU7376852.1 hypothetical protein [Hominibacterium faecale]MCU7379401.1 hypothetical protein [Hominibacterium faecale]
MAIREWRNEGLSPLVKLAGRAFLLVLRACCGVEIGCGSWEKVMGICGKR